MGKLVPILTINEEKLDNKIIILKKDALTIRYKVTQNPFTKTKEKLSVIFEENPIQVSIEVKSIIKIDNLNKEEIKILQFRDSK